MKKVTRFARSALAIAALAVASQAGAADDRQQHPIKSALDKGQQYKDKISDEIPLYFGGQKTPPVQKKHGEWTATRNSNTFGKDDQVACDIAMIGALVSLQDRARKEGGNAIVNIKSLHKQGDSDSATDYLCTSGRAIARVSLRGTVVTLGKAAPEKKAAKAAKAAK